MPKTPPLKPLPSQKEQRLRANLERQQAMIRQQRDAKTARNRVRVQE